MNDYTPPAEKPCGSRGIVCVDYTDDSNPSDLGGHIHVHADTWKRMKDLGESIETAHASGSIRIACDCCGDARDERDQT